MSHYVFMEPHPTGGHAVVFVPREHALASMRVLAEVEGRSLTDQQLLISFEAVHFPSTLVDVIERMAKAMYMNTYKVEEARWADAAKDSWRAQALAALKALGVVV